MSNRLSVGGIYCHLEKVFVCVNHGIVVDKLEFSGISGKSHNLMQPYLRGRYRTYTLVQLIHMIVFLLDGKKLPWSSPGYELGCITFSYL